MASAFLFLFFLATISSSPATAEDSSEDCPFPYISPPPPPPPPQCLSGCSSYPPPAENIPYYEPPAGNVPYYEPPAGTIPYYEPPANPYLEQNPPPTNPYLDQHPPLPPGSTLPWFPVLNDTNAAPSPAKFSGVVIGGLVLVSSVLLVC